MVKGFTTPLVVAKHGLSWNVGLEARDTVPAIWPSAGEMSKKMVAPTLESNAEPLSALKASSICLTRLVLLIMIGDFQRREASCLSPLFLPRFHVYSQVGAFFYVDTQLNLFPVD